VLSAASAAKPKKSSIGECDIVRANGMCLNVVSTSSHHITVTQSTERALHLSSIGQIALPVRDLSRAVRFYRDTLGMKFLFEAPPALAFFDCDGIRLMLDRPEQPKFERHSSILYFRVADIEATYALLQSRHVRMEDAPHLIHRFPDHELWMCFFYDTEENMLALMSEVPIKG
jgi:methylmalonyl-CoA/ethylmalonyl-CoA epimerase